MNWDAISFDWNQIRAFLAAAEEGSLSAAARALGQTQPTLSRQVTALEESLGVTLFERGRRAVTLTETGLQLLEHVRAMGEAANRVSLAATGRSQAIEGKVAITATNAMATYQLPEIIKMIRQEAPLIEIEIVTSNQIQDLTRREADISIRHARPEQADLIGKLIAETSAHLYASRAYLDENGRPENAIDLTDADFIGFEQPERLLPVLNSLGLSLTLDNFKIVTASGTVMLEFVRQGLGIGMLTKDVEARFPDIERVLPELAPVPVPVWLVTHRELRTSRRVRLVFDILAKELPKRINR